MATITNQCDVLLQATTPRMLNVSSNFITVTPTTNAFSTTATSTSPSSIAVRASLSGELRGTVTWSTAPTVAFTVAGNILTLPATSVAAGSSVTVTATLTLYGQTYTSSATISHQADTVTSSLSSSAVTISTNTDGTGGTYTGATSTMSVTIGTVDNSTSWSYAWTVPSGVTATGQATRTIAVSAMTVDTATLTCTATRAGWATQTKSFTVSKSKNGSIGTNGTRTAILDLYRWSATTPTTFPVGTSTYNWTTAQFTAPGTLNSWTTTPGASVAGQTLYIARQIYTDSSSTTTSTVTWSTTTAIALSSAGTNGANGTRTAFLEVYRWSATVPTTFPAGTSTYTWATGAFTAPGTPNSWGLTPGASSPGQTLYACSIRFSDNLTTTTSSVTWNTSTAYVVGAAGANGSPGANGSATYLIDRGASTSSTAPTVAEVTTATSRSPILGDIANIKYNNGVNAISYRCTLGGASATWTVQTSYLAGSLIIENTLSASKITSGATAISGLNFGGQTITGNFKLGSTDRTPAGNTAAIGLFECATIGGVGLMAINSYSGTSTDFANGALLVTKAVNGVAFGAYNLASQTTSVTNMRAYVTGGYQKIGAEMRVLRTNSYSQTLDSSNLGNKYTVTQVNNCIGNTAGVFQFWGGESQTMLTSSLPRNYVTIASDTDSASFIRRDESSNETGRIILNTTDVNNNTYAIYVHGEGRIATKARIPGGVTPFTGAHEAYSDTELTVGDIVVDTELLESIDISNTVFLVEHSSQQKQKNVIGVVADTFTKAVTPVIEEDTGQETDQYTPPAKPPAATEPTWHRAYKVLVNALGEGQVNVCGQNGNIEAGDLITTSLIAGKGMRQEDDLYHSYTVAKARESVTFDYPAQVKMIACTYHCG